MGGEIMIRNLIIVALVLIIVYDVSSDQALGYVQSTLDFLQQLVYDVKESCLLYTSPSPRDAHESRMPSSA